jgi:hypothetical protein
MATIRYTKTYFNKPNRINEEAYNAMKRELTRNANFEIDPNPETFSEHFSGSLKIIKICGIVIIACLFISFVLGIDKRGDYIAAPAGIGVFVIIFTGIHLLLEGPSFATYVKEKTEYFSRMKYAIQNTNSYREFSLSFYGN